jgi:hypothetical protein
MTRKVVSESISGLMGICIRENIYLIIGMG